MNAMIRRIGVLLLLVFAAVTGFHCRREKMPVVLTGKLVDIAACNGYIVQILSGPIPDSSVLVKSWTNSLTDSTYTNVFTVKDGCTFAAALLSQGDVFTFTLNGEAPNQTCFTCDIVIFPLPSVYNTVTNIKLVGH